MGHKQTLREVIGRKLVDGQLPYHSIAQVWHDKGDGEPCDACDLPIERPQFVMDGEASPGGARGVHLHVGCFYIWETLRTLSPRLPAEDPLDVEVGAPGRN